EKVIFNLNLKLSCCRNETSKSEGKCVAPFTDYKIFKTYKKSLSKTKAQNKKGIQSHRLKLLNNFKLFCKSILTKRNLKLLSTFSRIKTFSKLDGVFEFCKPAPVCR